MNRPEATCVCIECKEPIDMCCFCESEECDRALCYRCLIIVLGESMPHPHTHGG